MAHHLAELISEAEKAVGEEKRNAEARAVDTILKLWTLRRALPEPVDPLSGLRLAIDVLGRMSPEADPWARNKLRPNPPILAFEPVLSDIFQTLSRTVMAGLLLTLNARLRPILKTESAMLGPEEDRLLTELDTWKDYVRQQPAVPRVKINYVVVSPDDAAVTEDGTTPEPDDEVADIELVEDGADDGRATESAEASDKTNSEDEQLRTVVLENLRAARDQVDRLIDRWERTLDALEEEDDDD